MQSQALHASTRICHSVLPAASQSPEVREHSNPAVHSRLSVHFLSDTDVMMQCVFSSRAPSDLSRRMDIPSRKSESGRGYWVIGADLDYAPPESSSTSSPIRFRFLRPPRPDFPIDPDCVCNSQRMRRYRSFGSNLLDHCATSDNCLCLLVERLA